MNLPESTHRCKHWITAVSHSMTAVSLADHFWKLPGTPTESFYLRPPSLVGQLQMAIISVRL